MKKANRICFLLHACYYTSVHYLGLWHCTACTRNKFIELILQAHLIVIRNDDIHFLSAYSSGVSKYCIKVKGIVTYYSTNSHRTSICDRYMLRQQDHLSKAHI